MRKTLTACSLLVGLFGGLDLSARPVDPTARPTGAHVPGPHVRGASPRMTYLLEQAIARSSTFAALVKAIDATDVIVHVEEVRTLSAGVDGRLLFVHAAGGVRYLRAQVLMGRSVVDTMSTVGHELQHALEVATNTHVRDQGSFAALYGLIGDHPIRPDQYDTPAAREAGRRVRSEMS